MFNEGERAQVREEREYSGGSKMSRERRVREGDTKQIENVVRKSCFFLFFPGEPAYTALFVIFFFMLKSHGLFVDVSCLNSVVCYLLF